MWFAFSSLNSRYLPQQKQSSATAQACCDLLSVLWILDIYHNYWGEQCYIHVVVICFQFFEFSIFTTTPSPSWPSNARLWFAFSSLNSRYLPQLFKMRIKRVFSCDLLSVLWILDIYHNATDRSKETRQVVICFQFFEFSIFTTTILFSGIIKGPLWFAFSSLNSRYLPQQRT